MNEQQEVTVCHCQIVGWSRDPYEPHIPAQPEWEQAADCPVHPLTAEQASDDPVDDLRARLMPVLSNAIGFGLTRHEALLVIDRYDAAVRAEVTR